MEEEYSWSDSAFFLISLERFKEISEPPTMEGQLELIKEPRLELELAKIVAANTYFVFVTFLSKVDLLNYGTLYTEKFSRLKFINSIVDVENLIQDKPKDRLESEEKNIRTILN